MAERFTLVLTTHNRPAFVRRALRYYSRFPCAIIVVDSSTQAAEELSVEFPHIDYQHVPQFSYLGFQAKLKHGIARVKTPLMAFAADDDFLLPGALIQSVEFLETHADYGMCHGYCLMYLTEATRVRYFRRDKKVTEDYASERAEERVLAYMGEFIPPFFAVTRTQLLLDWYEAMPEALSFQWQEIGHAYYLLARAKARILPIPYVVREANYGASEHNTEVFHTLAYTDAKSVEEREQFAVFLSNLPTAIRDLDQEQTRQFALQAFEAMADCLRHGRSLGTTQIFLSTWNDPLAPPVRTFLPTQYVELPFYNQAFFDLLIEIEFLLHAMPAGRLQLKQLEAVLLKQENLLRVRPSDSNDTYSSNLLQALHSNVFNRRVVKLATQDLLVQGRTLEATALSAWAERLDVVSTQDAGELLARTPSGQTLDWVRRREPDARQAKTIASYLAARGNAPEFCVLILDPQGSMADMQATFDSLLNCHYRNLKIVVLTQGDLPAVTREQDTLHFIKVSAGNTVDKLNQVTRDSTADWVVLAQAGDEFTASGLLRAGLELAGDSQCRAVAMDEIQCQADGTWEAVLRPAFNLDLLQSLPSLMSRHWLLRREALVAAGGFAREFSQALEYDLLLRLIEHGGLAGLAHLDEPLLVTRSVAGEEVAHERLALVRHLASRGYQAQVGSSEPGTWQINYRHGERPLVSIVIACDDDLPALQRCLDSVLQRTRYARYEVLIATSTTSASLLEWLAALPRDTERLRIVQGQGAMSRSQLYNLASREAKGEYLVLLAGDGEVVNANWIESLLNQAQRPEVGVVGAKLVDAEGSITSAGLVLGVDAGVAAAFSGEKKDAKGHMHRLLVEQGLSAVSGACLMVRKSVFDEVGGLDEGVFAEHYGDVDLCLKVGATGLLVVWTPQAQFAHPGEVPASAPALVALREKWHTVFEQDPAYSPQLAFAGKTFALAATSSLDWAQLLDQA